MNLLIPAALGLGLGTWAAQATDSFLDGRPGRGWAQAFAAALCFAAILTQ